MMFMMVFSAYFTGTYFLAIDNYQVTAQSVNDLNTVIFKDSCFENWMQFEYENLIRN